MSLAKSCLLLSLSCLALSTVLHGKALAQAGVPSSGATADAAHVTVGRDSDNAVDQIKSYNDFVGKTAATGPAPIYVNTGAKFTPVSAADQVAAMGAGVNILSGGDPYWSGQKSSFSDEDFARVAAAGFKTVRVPLDTFKHIVDTQGNLDPAYLKRLDHIVDLAIANHLQIILDEHNFEECAKDADGCSVLLPNVWFDLAQHYQTAPSSVMFELLNEPNGQVDAKIWNGWLPDLIATVRQFDPSRNIIIGPVMWNSSSELDNLQLPDSDKHIIVTFHYYLPMEFTHQGASWVASTQGLRGVQWTGSGADLDAISTSFDKVKAWGVAHDRPIFLGEYGTYGKFNPNLSQRAAWTAAVSKAADQRGFARAYWFYSDGGGFGIYDGAQKAWLAPLVKALLPNSPAAQ